MEFDSHTYFGRYTTDELVFRYKLFMDKMYLNVVDKSKDIESVVSVVLLSSAYDEMSIRMMTTSSDNCITNYYNMYVHYETAKMLFPNIFVPRYLKLNYAIKRIKPIVIDNQPEYDISLEGVNSHHFVDCKETETRRHYIHMSLFRHNVRKLEMSDFASLNLNLIHKFTDKKSGCKNLHNIVKIVNELRYYILDRMSQNYIENSLYGYDMEYYDTIWPFIIHNTLNVYEINENAYNDRLFGIRLF